MTSILRIATRQSPMAMFQANEIKKKIHAQHPILNIEIIGFSTKGDRELSTPLKDIGGKSLFVKELQRALLENQADIAVHCIKDMSVQEVPGLYLGAICKRDDAHDAFVSNHYKNLSELPQHAIVGTSSPRRQCLLRQIRPDLTIKDLRGNVNTRLKKLDEHEYDAIILAAAGLQRLDMPRRIREYLPPSIFIPAIGQGALGIECRDNDMTIYNLIKHLNDQNSAACVIAERAVNTILGGNCHTPLGAYATLQHNRLSIKAFAGCSKTGELITVELQDTQDNAAQLGKHAGEMLLEKGADQYLND